jgi:hypothetical protein
LKDNSPVRVFLSPKFSFRLSLFKGGKTILHLPLMNVVDVKESEQGVYFVLHSHLTTKDQQVLK